MGRSTNIFRFISFTERISKLRIDVVHKIEKRSDTPDESDTFFNQSLSKWRELNCCLDFQEFYKGVSPLVKSLSLLVHHQKSVIDILQKYLKKKDTLALEALLQLCVELARDLQGDFTQYFRDFLGIITKHLDTKDAEKIENCFKTLAYLFKFQWRFLIKDMKSLFRSYSPLLSGNQPGQVYRFAAESLAFLVRKTKNLSKLLDFIFLSTLQNPQILPGVGRLLSEMLRGVQNRFHSSAEEIMKLLLNKLAPDVIFDEEFKSGNKIFQLFTIMFEETAKFAKREHCQVIWSCLYKAINDRLLDNDVNVVNSEILRYLVELMNIWVEWSHGKLINDATKLQKNVSNLMKTKTDCDTLKSSIFKLASSTLKLSFDIDEDLEEQLLVSFFASKHFSISDACNFSRNLKMWAKFNDLVLPRLVNFFDAKLAVSSLQEFQAIHVLHILAEILSDTISFEEGYDGMTLQQNREFCFPKLADEHDDCWWNVFFKPETIFNVDEERIWTALIVLPFLRPLKFKTICQSLRNLFDHLNEQAKGSSSTHSTPLLFVLSQCVKCIAILCKFHSISLEQRLAYHVMFDVFSNYARDVHMLQAFHVYLSILQEQSSSNLSCQQNFKDVYACIKENLASHARLVRLLTLKILTTFDQLEATFIQNNDCLKCNIFNDCLQVELVPLTFQEYRRKVVCAQKLAFSNTRSLPNDIKDGPLRYLIGMLYLNLSTMWDPVMSLITTYAIEENKMMFWSVFYEYLILDPSHSDRNDEVNFQGDGALKEFFYRQFLSSVGPREDNRVDKHSFQLLLWKTMANFPEIVEPRSRQVVPLFLDFFRNECSVLDEAGRVSYQDLTKSSLHDSDYNSMVSDHVSVDHLADIHIDPTDGEHKTTDSELDTNDLNNKRNGHVVFVNDGGKKRSGSKYNKIMTKTGRSMKMKTLTACLTLFGLFKNPRKIYEESEMMRVYLTLLTQKDGEIQKLSLACLMTYKFEYMMPYRENFDRLMEDKTFSDEIMCFSSDEELNVVIPEHREQVIHILIRILYGKMQRWTGVGTRGKSGGNARRSLVLRFLNSCHGEEMGVFMDLITHNFKDICDNDNVDVCLNQVVPLRKQLGFLNMFTQIMAVLGNQASHYLPRLLKILFYCLRTSRDCLGQRDKVTPGAVSNLRSVRQLAIRCLSIFFERFPEQDFGLHTLDNSFLLAIAPQVLKLSSEALQTPTPLLRLLNVCSKNTRLHCLLSRVPTGTQDCVLGHVFQCLTSDHVCTPVATMILEMADRLMSPANEGETANDKMIAKDENIAPHSSQQVLPYVSIILEYLNKRIRRTTKNLSKMKGKLCKNHLVTKTELSVLSHISPYIVDSDQSLHLCRLMVSILNMTNKEESKVEMLKSIKNLLKNVQDPMIFYSQFSRLFSTLHSRETRKELCHIFSIIALKNDVISEHAQLLHGLNAWNRRQVDEVDYETRLSAFSQSTKLVKLPEAKGELIMPLFLNATHTVFTTTDLALRYSALGFMKNVIDVIEEKKDDTDCNWFNVIVLGCLFPAIREAVQSRHEAARNEMLLILGRLVKTFHHSKLNELKVLCSDDPEVDFFENIVHIQIHRRVRALRRLSSTCADTTFSSHTLTSVILPLVSHFVFEYKAVKDHNLVTEAINTIAVISTQLPWSKYSSLLRHYLRLLTRDKEMQKVISRVVVSILDSFHFDLRSLKEEDINGVDILKCQQSESKEKIEEMDDQQSESKEKMEEMDDQQSESKEKMEEVDDQQSESKEKIEEMDDQQSGNHEEEEETEDIEEESGDPHEDSSFELKLKIHAVITSKILPQLHKCLMKKLDSNDFHRLSGRKEDDENEILRVPMVLAMVKLLQALPQKTLESNLPGLLMRVCQALKSRAFDVRETARETLSKITISLGLYYFPFILNELRSSLTRGYQLHVLSATLFYILNKFQENISDGGLDVTINNIVEILVEDLFGEPAKEREIDKIATKLPEARTTKSFDCFEIVMGKISPAQLMTVVTPLKHVLDEASNHKISLRVEEVLRKLSVGLQRNLLFLPEKMLIFVHSLVTERLPLMKPDVKGLLVVHDEQDERLKPSNTYLIPLQPLRGGKVAEVNHRANTYILINFGLQLLHTALKRQKLMATEEKHCNMLDPFVSILTNALKSNHVKITTISLRCICWIVKYPLPSLRQHVVHIAARLFKLLKNHAKTGGASGDNQEMVLSSFKTITVLIRDYIELNVTEQQLRILLTFVEEDLYDHNRRSCAFPLLKAILSRKLQVSEINDVMLKVSELSIVNDSQSARLQCRQVLLQYLLDYPVGKKMKRYMEFFVHQLQYEHASGRESALEMLISIVNSFPEKVVFLYSGLFFLPLCTRLVNDESTNCRKLTAVAVKTLIGKLDLERRDNLFRIVMTWMDDEKMSLQRLASHVCGLFVNVEGKSFERRVPEVLPKLFTILKPENYNLKSKQAEKNSDNVLINAVMCLMKITQECSILSGKESTKISNSAWDSILCHLTYPHTWVRLISSRLFGLLFSQHSSEDIATISKDSSRHEYLSLDIKKKIASLCEAFLEQLKSQHVDEDLGDQIVKNLFYLSKVIILMNKDDVNYALNDDTEDSEEVDNVTLSWLLRKLSNIAKYESSQTPKLIQKRLSVFRWIAAVASHLGSENISSYLPEMLKPVHRELDHGSNSVDEKLRGLALEVVELLKNIVGHEIFSKAYATAKQCASEMKTKRKMQTAFEMVANPEASVAKKMKRNLAKRENRKRKFESKKAFKKSKKLKI